MRKNIKFFKLKFLEFFKKQTQFEIVPSTQEKLTLTQKAEIFSSHY